MVTGGAFPLKRSVSAASSPRSRARLDSSATVCSQLRRCSRRWQPLSPPSIHTTAASRRHLRHRRCEALCGFYGPRSASPVRRRRAKQRRHLLGPSRREAARAARRASQRRTASSRPPAAATGAALTTRSSGGFLPPACTPKVWGERWSPCQTTSSPARAKSPLPPWIHAPRCAAASKTSSLTPCARLARRLRRSRRRGRWRQAG